LPGGGLDSILVVARLDRRKSPKFPQIPLSCKHQGLNLAAALTIWLRKSYLNHPLFI
jgi:hypothetical protein